MAQAKRESIPDLYILQSRRRAVISDNDYCGMRFFLVPRIRSAIRSGVIAPKA
jgi:hypothetical protein